MTKPAGASAANPDQALDRGTEPAPEPAFDPALIVVPGVALRRAELRWRFSRAGGPGGPTRLSD